MISRLQFWGDDILVYFFGDISNILKLMCMDFAIIEMLVFKVALSAPMMSLLVTGNSGINIFVILAMILSATGIHK